MKKMTTSQDFFAEYSFEEYIQILCKDLLKVLNHQEYRLYILYKCGEEPTNERNIIKGAEIATDTIYLQATLTLYKPIKDEWDAKNFSKLGMMIAHELCHLLTEPQHYFTWQITRQTDESECEAIRERQTQRIANIVCKLLPEEYFNPKNIL